MDTLHQMNAEHAKQSADCTKTETLALLRKKRGLSDEKLDRSVPVLGGPPKTAQQMVEQVLIGHMQEHHGSIRAFRAGTPGAIERGSAQTDAGDLRRQAARED
jgi:hypothetical protein